MVFSSGGAGSVIGFTRPVLFRLDFVVWAVIVDSGRRAGQEIWVFVVVIGI